MTAADLLARLDGVRKTGRGFIAKCPAHADKSPSLSIAEVERGLLLHCFSGCTVEAVCQAVGLTLADLFFERSRGDIPSRRPSHPALRTERPEEVEYRLWACSIGLRLRALAVLDAARNCTTAEWTDADFDRAMRYVIRAHDDLRQAEVCERLAFALRCELIEKRRAAA